MTTKILPISDLRRQTSRIIGDIQQDGDVVYITQHDRPVAVLVDYEQYEALVAKLAELNGRAAMEAATAEQDHDYYAFLTDVGHEGQ